MTDAGPTDPCATATPGTGTAPAPGDAVQDADAALAALVGSRICHDLISPIGAIGNGLELLALAGVANGPEMQLLADSVAAATARARFFRIAFGSGADTPMGAQEVAGILDDLARGGRLGLVWDIAGPRPRSAVRTAFLALQCVEAALPGGGTIRISQPDGAAWCIAGDGPRLRPDPDAWAVLEGRSPATLPPRQVQFMLLRRILVGDGRAAVIRSGPDRIEIAFAPAAR